LPATVLWDPHRGPTLLPLAGDTLGSLEPLMRVYRRDPWLYSLPPGDVEARVAGGSRARFRVSTIYGQAPYITPLEVLACVLDCLPRLFLESRRAEALLGDLVWGLPDTVIGKAYNVLWNAFDNIVAYMRNITINRFEEIAVEPRVERPQQRESLPSQGEAASPIGRKVDPERLHALMLYHAFAGRLSVFTPGGARTLVGAVLEPQTALTRFSRLSDRDRLLYRLFYGDVTSMMVAPLISHYGRFYGIRLWRGVTAIYRPYSIIDEYFETYPEHLDNHGRPLAEVMSDPIMAGYSSKLVGSPYANLYVEAIDVYFNTIFTSVWHRAVVTQKTITDLLCEYSRARGKRGEHDTLHHLLEKLCVEGQDLVAVPLIDDSRGFPEAVVFKQRLPVHVVSDWEKVLEKVFHSDPIIRAQKAEEIARYLRAPAVPVAERAQKAVRSALAQPAGNGKRVFDLLRGPYSFNVDLGVAEIEFAPVGVAYDIVNPLVDLARDPYGMLRPLQVPASNAKSLAELIMESVYGSTNIWVYVYILLAVKRVKRKTSSPMLGSAQNRFINTGLPTRVLAAKVAKSLSEVNGALIDAFSEFEDVRA